MERKVLTGAELRRNCAGKNITSYTIQPGTLVTPEAREYLTANGIVLNDGSETPAAAGNQKPRMEKPEEDWSFAPVMPAAAPVSGTRSPAGCGSAPGVTERTVCRKESGYATMTVQALGSSYRSDTYVDAATGQMLTSKPEDYTHLRENLLVPKTDARIAFRGKMDSLGALILRVQVMADREGNTGLCDAMGELLQFVRRLLAAEVKEELLPPVMLLGMEEDRIHYMSHHIREEFGIPHPTPDYRMGELAVELNFLRTQVREAELAAVRAFAGPGGHTTRPDIVQGLNRLSSCVYILFCQYLSEH